MSLRLAMFKRHNLRLDAFAKDIDTLERNEVVLHLPPEPGVDPETVHVTATFNPSPGEQLMAAIGIKNPLNGILYIREAHCPVNLAREFDRSVPVGLRVTLRGRDYRVSKALKHRFRYVLVLSDNNQVNDG